MESLIGHIQMNSILIGDKGIDIAQKCQFYMYQWKTDREDTEITQVKNAMNKKISTLKDKQI